MRADSDTMVRVWIALHEGDLVATAHWMSSIGIGTPRECAHMIVAALVRPEDCNYAV